MPIELGSSHRGAEHEFMIKVVGQALGEYGDMIIDHIEKKIAEEVGKLRAEVNLKRASDDGDVVPLPNPLRKWSEQAAAGRA